MLDTNDGSVMKIKLLFLPFYSHSSRAATLQALHCWHQMGYQHPEQPQQLLDEEFL